MCGFVISTIYLLAGTVFNVVYRKKEYMEYAELLNRLTVDCKDDGKQFQKKDRIHEIKALLENSSYELLGEGCLSLLYGKRMGEGSAYRTLVSSHVDCVYKNCFVEDEDVLCWKGTFDNSATNAAVIDLMLRSELDESVLVAFTGDEEKDSAGAIEIMQMLGRMKCRVDKVLVLDVTNEGWEDEAAFSIENDCGFDIITGYHIVGLLQASDTPCVFVHEAEPDETWEYSKGIGPDMPGIPCLSLCLPVCGNMHGDDGVLLRKSSVIPYEDILRNLANAGF